MAKLKFGSPAWRAKYMKSNRPKRKARAKKKSTAFSRGTRAKKARMREMIAEGRRTTVRSNHNFAYWEKREKADRARRVKALAKQAREHERAEARKERKNPPRNWMKVKAIRVVSKNGHQVLEVKR